MRDVAFTATSHALAPGLYRWPTRWRVTWTDRGGLARLDLTSVGRNRVSNWLVAGLGMAAVEGRLRYSGTEVAVHGFGELLATAPPPVWTLVTKA